MHTGFLGAISSLTCMAVLVVLAAINQLCDTTGLFSLKGQVTYDTACI